MKLHEFQARGLESMLILADESLLRMRRLLREQGQQGIIRRITNTMSDAKRTEISKKLQVLLELFEEFAAQFSLEHHPLDLQRVVEAELSSLWVNLQDCRPDRMKGYGQPFAPDAKILLERSVEGLLAQIEDMRAILLNR
jgi:hypothetical protein